MAMRMPRFLKPDDHTLPPTGDWLATGPRPLGEPAPILQWPNASPSAAEDKLGAFRTSKVLIRTKRFSGHAGAAEDRFTAVIESASASPIGMVQALARVLETSEEMNRESRPGEPFILEIRLVAS